MSYLSATGWRANAVRPDDVETVRRSGREYLVFPVIPLVEMVLDYPERGTKEYLPASSIHESAPRWQGVPLTYVHPTNRNRTARDPDAFMGERIGMLTDPEVVDGEKLAATGVVDVAKAESLGGKAAQLVDDLRSGKTVEVSAGYATSGDEFQTGSFDGTEYDVRQGEIHPDHVAVFPSTAPVEARCSPEDGCAAPRANAAPAAAQRANSDDDHGANVSMTDANADVGTDAGSTEAMLNDLVEMLKRVEAMGVSAERAGEMSRLRSLAESLQDVDGDVGPALAELVDASKAVVAETVNDSPKHSDSGGSRENAGPCGCGGACGCDSSFTSGESSSPNMAAVPGHVERDVGRERTTANAEEYPAGGRSAWERRAVGLNDVPDDNEYRAGGRSAYEARRENATSEVVAAAAETHLSAGARRALTAKDGVDVDVGVNAEKYPLTALRQAVERAERAHRNAELKDQMVRNEARAASDPS